MTFSHVALFFLFSYATLHVDGYSSYQKKIPNGDKIPHPCKPNTIWTGVGHLSQFGGGKRNPFGVAFMNAGYKWTKQLCEADSDGDGKKNGEELGDPNCVWTEGNQPVKTSGLSHPGVCEPVDSAKCSSQKWISCTGAKAACSGRTEAGVLTHEVRFPKTKVPPKETNYYCKTFKLPSDQDYHIVASEAVLDNTKVIHHMIIYGCSEDMKIEKDPFNCIMGSARCNDFLVGWTVGDEGDCSPKQAGIRFGKNSFKYVQLQVHWTNDQKAANMYDSSGLKLYYTPNLRKYDLGVLTTGQILLELPPGRSKVVQQGVCRSGCTNDMLSGLKSKGWNGLNVTGASMHAHFLGRNLSLAQYRNGKFIRFIGEDDAFSYNNPTTKRFDPPVVLYPGDELKTTCIYDTRKRTKFTYYGDGTYEEMCFAFVNYYPKLPTFKQNLCLSYERYSFCDMKIYKNVSFYKHNFGSCNMTDFDRQGYVPNVVRACESKPRTCSKDCKYYVEKMDAHRCMKGMERKMYDGLMWDGDNATAIAVWNARATCAKSDKIGHASRLAALPSSVIAFLIIAVKFIIG